MFGAILKPTNSSFQKGMTFCRSIYVKKVMKLLAFIFEQPSYTAITPLICLVRVCTKASVFSNSTTYLFDEKCSKATSLFSSSICLAKLATV